MPWPTAGCPPRPPRPAGYPCAAVGEYAWGSKSYYTQLRLDPLPPETAEALLQALVGDDGALLPLRRLLIDLTQGNPFFLEESVRTLVEMKALVGERGAYRLAKTLQTIQVPPTVQAVLAARVDGLAPEDKALPQAASVIGKNVPLALLQAIADLPAESLRGDLARLQAGEFLYETRLFPDVEYTFKHALTLEVAYGGLLYGRAARPERARAELDAAREGLRAMDMTLWLSRAETALAKLS